MNQRTNATHLVIASVITVGLILSFGCNDILGNSEGTPRVVSAITVDSGSPPAGDAIQSAIEATSCTDGQKTCFGVCVGIDQANTGCADGASCTACSPSHVTGTRCDGSDTKKFECSFSGCSQGYADCNGQKSDGCETQLGTPENCGDCNEACADPKPLCAQLAVGFKCVASCDLGLTACGKRCVNTTNSLSDCGGCNKACADRPNASATCEDSGCKYTCFPGFHDCGGTCVSDTDPATCGSSCTACPTTPNTIATCTAGICGLQCTGKFHDCNHVPDDGCETLGLCGVTSPPPTCGCGTSSGTAVSYPIHPTLQCPVCTL